MKWVVPFLCITLLLAGCGREEVRKLNKGETLRVMASTPSLASLAMAVAGDDAKVELLSGDGGSPHEYEPTIGDRRRLQESHLLLVNGLALEPFDAGKLAKAAGAKLVDCSAGIPTDWLLGGDEGHGKNPHVWLSTEGAIFQAQAITSAMTETDPAHADGYRARFGELKQKLEALRAEFVPKVKALAKRKFVSNHDAFPYFAREFGLEQVGVIQRTPGSNPTVEQRREIQNMLTRKGADAIFMEPGFDDSASRAIAESSGLPLATLNPFGIGKPAPDALQTILRQNLETVLKTLGD